MSLKETRRNTLVKEGFTKWEARALSRNGIKTPAMQQLRKERRELFNDFILELSARELSGQKVPKFSVAYNRYIYKMYETERWYTLDGQRNPFARLREISDRNKMIDPQNWREAYTGISMSRRNKRATKGQYAIIADKTRNKGNSNKITQDEKTIGQSKAKQAEKKARLKLSEVD